MKISTLILATSVALISFSTVSCKKKGCTNQYADNFDADAKEDDGSCTLAKEKFYGSYATDQTCVYGGDADYTMTVSSGVKDNEVLFTNFADLGLVVTGVISGSNVTVKDETQGIVVEGDGYILGNKLYMDFELCESFYYPCSDPEICSFTATK